MRARDHKRKIESDCERDEALKRRWVNEQPTKKNEEKVFFSFLKRKKKKTRG